jgi:PAS domain S-box-containing protein
MLFLEMDESAETLRSLFEDAPIAYHEIDRQGCFRRVNRTECRLLGYEREEMLGKPVWSFVAPEEQASSRDAVRKKLSGSYEFKPFCREYVRQDGARVVMEIHESLIRAEDGTVFGIRSSMLDVTERERALRELARKSAELARSNEELEQFAYVASHDLQEPLRKILAFGDRLLARSAANLDEHGKDYLDRMCKASARMQTLINDLLELSRVKTRANPFKPVDLNAVVRQVLSDLELRIEAAGARVDAGPLPGIQADVLQMGQLFQNLIGNALKFRRAEAPPEIRVHGELCESGGQRVARITVADNGIGFEAKYADRIFQVFQRLHGRGEYEGTGIGLAICRRIAERHHGSITAQSAPGAGAAFLIELPAEQAEETQL